MADPDVAVVTPGSLADPSHSDLGQRLALAGSQMAAAYERARGLLLRAECALAENKVLRRAFRQALRDRQSLAPRPELLQQSEYARMAARLQTMPVIEQAKGIIMGQQRCGPDEAFDLLRRASQHSNIPVRELAAQIVATTMGGPVKRRDTRMSIPAARGAALRPAGRAV